MVRRIFLATIIFITSFSMEICWSGNVELAKIRLDDQISLCNSALDDQVVIKS